MIHTMHSTIRSNLKTRLTACCDRCLKSGVKTELKRFKFAGSQLQHHSPILDPSHRRSTISIDHAQ